MTRVIVHAGFHKTGTSSLQDFLTQNRGALKPVLAYYGKADFPEAGSHARIYGQRRFWWRKLLFRRAFQRFLTGIPDAPLIVLSRETLAGVMPGHRRLGGRRVENYRDAAIPLAREILRGLRHRFGPDVAVDFLYTLRDRDSWLDSVHGHLLRSIHLTDDLADYQAGFSVLPDPEADANKIAKALAPVPVHIAWLEDYADLPEGPAGAVLDLAGIPDDLRRRLVPVGRRNQGQSRALRNEFLRINREGGSRAELKARKEHLLATIAAKPQKP